MQSKKPQVLGKPHKMVDGRSKVTGSAEYVGDLSFPGMLHAKFVLATDAHASIVSIDVSGALEVPGVVRALIAEDLPTKDKAITSRVSAILAKDRIIFSGQPVAVVVGRTAAAAADGASRVVVETDPLPAVPDLAAALADDAPVVWPHGLPTDAVNTAAAHGAGDSDEEEPTTLTGNVHKTGSYDRGDVEAGFREADVVVENTYTNFSVHQSYLETQGVVAVPDKARGGLTIYTSTQNQFGVRADVARLLSLDVDRVEVVPMTVGGGFGGKFGMLEPTAAAVAIVVQRPVRLVLDRMDDFLTTTPAPAARVRIKIGARKDGTLTAVEASMQLENGIFAFALGGLMGNLMVSSYRIPNIKVSWDEVVSHKKAAGAYRAPSATMAAFAMESNMDEVARELGLDPLEFRYANAAGEGDLMASDTPWPSIGLKKCLERLREHPDWTGRNTDKKPHRGVGFAVAGWPGMTAAASSICRVDTTGKVTVYVSAIDISGAHSSLALVAAEVLGTSADAVEVVLEGTRHGLATPASGGSAITHSLAGAVENAATKVRERIVQVAADQFEAAAEDIEITDGKVHVKGVPDTSVSLGELAGKLQNSFDGPGPPVAEGRSDFSSNSPGFVAHLVVVDVDPDTGHVQPVKYLAIQDAGFALNPLMVEGQMTGGAVQCIGWGLHEALIHDEHGQLINPSFVDYDLPKAGHAPPIETILIDNPCSRGPFGARSVGEPAVTAGAAALGNAIRDAVGVRMTDLPMTPELVWRAMAAE